LALSEPSSHFLRGFANGGFGSVAACQQFIIWAAANGHKRPVPCHTMRCQRPSQVSFALGKTEWIPFRTLSHTQGPLQTFLRAARDDACKIFRVVLGPDYNKAHEDHLHVDMGGGLRCK